MKPQHNFQHTTKSNISTSCFTFFEKVMCLQCNVLFWGAWHCFDVMPCIYFIFNCEVSSMRQEKAISQILWFEESMLYSVCKNASANPHASPACNAKHLTSNNSALTRTVREIICSRICKILGQMSAENKSEDQKKHFRNLRSKPRPR